MNKITFDVNIMNALKCAYFLQGYLFDHCPQVRGRVTTIINELEYGATSKNEMEEGEKKKKYREDEWKRVLNDV